MLAVSTDYRDLHQAHYRLLSRSAVPRDSRYNLLIAIEGDMSGYMHRLLLVGIVLNACADSLPKGPSHTLKTYPHATDRYARLRRQQIIDSDPMAIQQQITCEMSRLDDSLGGDEMILRTSGVDDTIYRTSADSTARAMIERTVAYHSFEVGGPLCDSLNAIANREDPIVRVDTASSPKPR